MFPLKSLVLKKLINQDLGLFNSLKDELNCINDGFKDAVSKEVASQKMKTELISNVSHDLKTPLTMIKAYAEMIRDISYKDQDKMNEHLGIIVDETDRLTVLVNDILDLSRMQSNADTLNIEKFDLALDIKNIVNNIVFCFYKLCIIFDIL